jgi:hypothetical protein
MATRVHYTRRALMPIDQIKRRDFITLLGGAAMWPMGARAQQPGRLIRLGFMGPTLNNPAAIEQYQTFLTQLRELGFREGQTIAIDYQGVDDPRGAFVAAAQLLRSQPDLIVAFGPEAALQAVIGASGFIPVIMIAVNFDPVARGYVDSLVRPGGNITGLVFQQLELAGKWLEALKDMAPQMRRGGNDHLPCLFLVRGKRSPQMPLTRLNDSAFDAQLEGVYFGMWNGSRPVRCFVSHDALTDKAQGSVLE